MSPETMPRVSVEELEELVNGDAPSEELEELVNGDASTETRQSLGNRVLEAAATPDQPEDPFFNSSI